MVLQVTILILILIVHTSTKSFFRFLSGNMFCLEYNPLRLMMNDKYQTSCVILTMNYHLDFYDIRLQNKYFGKFRLITI